MSAAYTKGVASNLGNAQVVYDKFHVIQNVVEACDQVRKAESRSDAGKRELLERTRWMWLKNRANWTEKETHKWESMSLERCVTGMAYEMRLVLQGIYQWKDAEVAKKMFGNWCAWVKAMREQAGELLEPMARAARMIEGHMEGILGLLESRPDDRLPGGTQQPVLSREAQGARVPDGGVHDQHALICRREARRAVRLTPCE